MDDDLRYAVWAEYSDAAARPRAEHPFPMGREFAQAVGYSEDLLAGIPESAVDAFTGVSNVSVFAEFRVGDTVLDLGCGAGLDSLVASWRVGDAGKVIGVDFSRSMLDRARAAGPCRVAFVLADGERLPLRNRSIDVALVNGIFNLNPARAAIFGELARILRPGGAVFGAELVLREAAKPRQSDRQDWFA